MRKLVAGLAALGIFAPAAAAAGNPSHYLKVSPSAVMAGHKVQLYGSVGNGCRKGAQVTITSRAFRGATTHKFAGIPAVLTTVGKNHSFSVQVKIKPSVLRGTYKVAGRCGGGNFGTTLLTVKSSSSPGFY